VARPPLAGRRPGGAPFHGPRLSTGDDPVVEPRAGNAAEAWVVVQAVEMVAEGGAVQVAESRWVVGGEDEVKQEGVGAVHTAWFSGVAAG